MSAFAERFLEEGMQKGRQEGMQQGEAQMLLRLMSLKFGQIPEDKQQLVESASKADAVYGKL